MGSLLTARSCRLYSRMCFLLMTNHNVASKWRSRFQSLLESSSISCNQPYDLGLKNSSLATEASKLYAKGAWTANMRVILLPNVKPKHAWSVSKFVWNLKAFSLMKLRVLESRHHWHSTCNRAAMKNGSVWMPMLIGFVRIHKLSIILLSRIWGSKTYGCQQAVLSAALTSLPRIWRHCFTIFVWISVIWKTPTRSKTMPSHFRM